MNFPIDLSTDDDDQQQKIDSRPLDPGLYDATIERAEMRTTKANGAMVSLMLRVIKPNPNRVIFDNINVVNANPIAQNIGRRTMKDILRIGGFDADSLERVEDLNGIKVEIVVDLKEADQWNPKGRNVIKKYKYPSSSFVIPATTGYAPPTSNMQAPF